MLDVNPTPFSFMILNSMGWVIYALMIDNLYVFFANMSGVLLGLFYMLTVMMTTVRSASMKDDTFPLLYFQLERQLLGALLLWILLSLVSTSSLSQLWFRASGHHLQRLIIGNTVMIFNVAYYASPFSTLLKVIRSKDSSSILAVMVSANLLDAGLWLIYAGAINDWYLMIPNALGVLLAVSQLIVRLLYCAKGPTYQELSKSTAVLVDDLTPSAEFISVSTGEGGGASPSRSHAFMDSTTVRLSSTTAQHEWRV